MNHNKKARLELEILSFMIAIVLISALIFWLVHLGIVEVKPGAETVSVLNMEFLPLGRGGELAIADFKFCGWVDEAYRCFDPKESFSFGEPVRFTLAVESSTFEGQVKLVENYQVVAPSGKVILEAEAKDNFNFELSSRNSRERISFKDYFIINPGAEAGTYTLSLIMYNPLIDKKVTLSKSFEVK